MTNNTSNYAGGRSVSGLVEAIGWVTATLGVLCTVLGFSDSGSSFDFSVSFKIISSIYWLSLTIVGLGTVMAARVAKALFDTADMTRQLLSIAENKHLRTAVTPSKRTSTSTERPSREEQLADDAKMTINKGDRYRLYMETEIFKDGNKYYVEGSEFNSEAGAERFIEVMREYAIK